MLVCSRDSRLFFGHQMPSLHCHISDAIPYSAGNCRPPAAAAGDRISGVQGSRRTAVSTRVFHCRILSLESILIFTRPSLVFRHKAFSQYKWTLRSSSCDPIATIKQHPQRLESYVVHKSEQTRALKVRRRRRSPSDKILKVLENEIVKHFCCC